MLDGAGAGAGVNGLNVLGGNSTLRGLMLSGFGGAGVAVSGAGGNRLEQCVITGSGGSGVLLGGAGGNRVANCTIFANGADGIAVSAGAANTFTTNSLYDNGDLGIDLGNDGPTPPDTGDPDIGANALLNGPVMLRAVPQGGAVQALGRFNGAPNTALTLEFFSVAACDPAGYGEGRTFLSSAPATTDASGDAYFMPALSGASEGSFVTATATDAAGNTSEFSACMRVGPDNDTWPEALDLPLAGDPGAAAYSQHLDRQGQSRLVQIRRPAGEPADRHPDELAGELRPDGVQGHRGRVQGREFQRGSGVAGCRIRPGCLQPRCVLAGCVLAGCVLAGCLFAGRLQPRCVLAGCLLAGRLQPRCVLTGRLLAGRLFAGRLQPGCLLAGCVQPGRLLAGCLLAGCVQPGCLLQRAAAQPGGSFGLPGHSR